MMCDLFLTASRGPRRNECHCPSRCNSHCSWCHAYCASFEQCGYRIRAITHSVYCNWFEINQSNYPAGTRDVTYIIAGTVYIKDTTWLHEDMKLLFKKPIKILNRLFLNYFMTFFFCLFPTGYHSHSNTTSSDSSPD